VPKPTSPEKQLEWKNLIEQQRQSGLSVDKWCLQNQIRPHTFHYWKDKQLQKSNFSELNMKRPNEIFLQARGLHVRIDGDCDPYLRKQLFALLAGLPC
jgi:hypothetical protein